MKSVFSVLALLCCAGNLLVAGEPHVSIRLVAPAASVVSVDNELQAEKTIPTLPFALKQNIPDPFDSVTSISFVIYEPLSVRLDILNSAGDPIAVLKEATFAAGEHTVTLDGSHLPGGLYYYRLVSGVYTAMRSMTKNATTDITDHSGTAKTSLVLSPNPSSGELQIRFAPSVAGEVTIELLSINGLYTTTLFHGRCEAREQTMLFSLDTETGSVLPSGQYWCRIVAPDGVTVAPLVLVK
jgi:hypothetical protein